MNVKLNRISQGLADALTRSTKVGTQPYDTPATVTRIEGDTAWVHISGGIDETPVLKTIDCKKGDSVQVRVSGGSAWITGNATAPPTDDTTARIARNSADTAVVTADDAKRDAGDAQIKADVADGKAENALGSTDSLLDIVNGETHYQYTTGGTTYDVEYDEDDGKYYYEDDGVRIEVAYDDLDEDEDGAKITTQVGGLSQDVSELTGAIEVEPTDPSITFKAQRGASSTSLKLTDIRLSFMDGEDEIIYMDSQEENGVAQIPKVRADSLRIGNLEIFKAFDGGIGIRRL